jgi:hypothetical protein
MARAYSVDLRERCGGSFSRLAVPGSGGAFRCQRRERGEMGPAGRCDGQPSRQTNGRQAALSFGGPAQLAAGSSRREARSDVTYALYICS